MPKKSKTSEIKKILQQAPERYHQITPSKTTSKEFKQQLPETIPEIIKEDISHYYNYLKNNRSEESLKKWEEASGCTDSPNSWKAKNYRPIFSFLYYDRVTDGMFLALILDRLEPLAEDHKEKITIEEFNRQCRLSILNYKPKIDEIDLKILKALSKDPTLVIKELTEETGHSYAAVYRHYQKLKEKLGLRILTRVNWRKLGIQPLYLLTQNPKDYERFENYEKYRDGQATFLWGKKHYLRLYYVDQSTREDIIQEFEKQRKEQQTLNLLELTSPPQIKWTFDLYDKKEQRWKIDFVKTYRFLKNTKEQQLVLDELFQYTYPPEEVYQLTPLETNIIDDLVGNYNLTQKELAEHLGMHAQNLSTIKLKLLEDDVIYPHFEIRNFLPMGSLLWCSSENIPIFEILIPLLQKLPFTNISPVRNVTDPEKKQILCFVYLNDIIYRNLIVFFSQLLDENQIDEFQFGMNIETYFGMAKVKDILKDE
ncbi:MAG: winged helix-turn-helix transcriptional regulator [Asgard group archaeon]|nr:winged helix-turn-helix transcriptional regulator [Asgard group archaeon]